MSVQESIVRQVENDSDELFDRCLKVLLEAFSTHPLLLMRNGHDQELIELDIAQGFAGSFAKKLVYVTGHDDQDISAVMGIMLPVPPKKEPEEQDKKEEAITNPVVIPAVDDREARLKKEYEAKWPEHLKKFIETEFTDRFKELKAAIGDEIWTNSHKVAMVGTSPSARGKGYGSALMRKVMDLAAEKGSWVLLVCWTQETADWYLSLGMKIEYECDFPTVDQSKLHAWYFTWKAQ
ncbi:hypothetical protein BD324DRAFT_620234 [Kockovaella imperatae]|uniref:N-acetyltransferase domain-containing protein n=1 Tax=Kockovaella imperatae TaxID=4999 RepID=A0A1Y1UJW7_9TREE|nr:hypothetical protein BD324DRAFT_620234 [Kockovaella imperatae]ORX38279.1 hypothetical protein BD324DRAFT_620234 [Kockovaella imperatae]